MNDLIVNFLKSHGFNETDVKIYLDVYKNGQVFASSIAARTEIDRTTIYSSLKRLLKKGVIIQSKVNEVRAYTAVSPEIFTDKIDREIEQLSASKKAASSFVEEITKLRKYDFAKPQIRIFEGVEAIMSLYEQTLIKGDTQKAFINLTTIPDNLKDFLKTQFIKSKLRKGVKSRVIIADTKYAGQYKKLDSVSNRKTKIIQKHPFKLHSEIILFNKKEVAIIDFHQQIYGIVIESETLFKTMEAMFDYIWETA